MVTDLNNAEKGQINHQTQNRPEEMHESFEDCQPFHQEQPITTKHDTEINHNRSSTLTGFTKYKPRIKENIIWLEKLLTGW